MSTVIGGRSSVVGGSADNRQPTTGNPSDEPKLLRILARRSLAVGLGCRSAACKHPEADPGPGATCPHLDECVEELEMLRRVAKGGGA